MQYQLCPNENSCNIDGVVAADATRVITAGTEELLVQKMDGSILKNDMCAYEITLPKTADSNDILTFKFEYIKGGYGTLFLGKTLSSAYRMFTVAPG